VYGVHLRQRRNDARIDANLFDNIVTQNKEVRDFKVKGRKYLRFYWLIVFP